MKITYLDHSGFALEAVNCTILIDYVKGKLPEFRPDKPLYILASHRHCGHFNERIFRLVDAYTDVYYFLSYDIDGGGRVPAKARKVTTFVHPGQQYKLARFHLDVFDSTDAGVSFSLKVGNDWVFHAGDLADWHDPNGDEATNRAVNKKYLKEVAKLQDHYDVAFLPVDPRLGAFASLGVREFLDHSTVDHLFPMQFWDDYSVGERLSKDLGREVEDVTKKGQVFETA